MTLRTFLLLFCACLGLSGCERDISGLSEAPLSTDPVVFDDNFGAGVDFQAFQGSRLTAVQIDHTTSYLGAASLVVSVPEPGATNGGFAGGAFPTNTARNLSGYNALTFWAKASQALTMDIAGLGNDNTGTSKYEASWSGIPLTTEWTKVVIPIPLPARLAAERGLFFFAEGPKAEGGHRIWLDEIQFELVDGITDPRPALTPGLVNAFAGTRVNITGTRTTFKVNGQDRTLEHQPGYFSFVSSNTDVAIVENEQNVLAVGGGTADITAFLGGVAATGKITLRTTEAPTDNPETPTLPASDVISLFSNAYSNHPVDTWSASWDRADVSDLRVNGNDIKGYTNLTFAGIEFTTQTVDATEMTHFHIDVWIKDSSVFRVKLVDFGEDGVFGGAPDSEQELVFNAGSTPQFIPGSWRSLDIPLASFTNLRSRGHIAQLIISGGTTAFIDNVYFHK